MRLPGHCTEGEWVVRPGRVASVARSPEARPQPARGGEGGLAPLLEAASSRGELGRGGAAK